ncbi:MAG: hypothetical protein V3V14_00545 [Saprospiraceae bacterium]
MNKNNRRQFLKNTSFVALALGTPILSAKRKAGKSSLKPDLLACNKTTLDFYGIGPFYTAGPPTMQENKLAKSTEVGDRIIISGRVFNLDCSQYIPNAIIDVWHANHNGEYDNQGYNLRGKTVSNSEGFYMFETIKPGKYLNGNVFRPSHIHFKITAPDFPTLATQLYFEGDPDNSSDPASSITSGDYDAQSRIISLAKNSDDVLEGSWDIVINGEGITTSVSDIHLDKGVIYHAGPIPFSDSINIRYGVYNKEKVSLLVFDTQGSLVATLEERTLRAGQYDAVWNPGASLLNGHYFIVLKINELQVHYIKVIRQRE